MSSANHIYTSQDSVTSVYEKMQDGTSYVFIHSDREDIRIPIKHFRELVTAWSNKKWGEEWDTLSVTDNCFPDEEE